MKKTIKNAISSLTAKLAALLLLALGCVGSVWGDNATPTPPEAIVTVKDAAGLAEMSGKSVEEVSNLLDDLGQGWVLRATADGVDMLSQGTFSTSTKDVFVFLPKDKDTDDETMAKFGNWYCDYVVSFNQDVAADSIILTGYYQNMLASILVGMPFQGNNVTKQFLISSVGFNSTYQQIVDLAPFICTAVNVSRENIGKTINVSLVMWQPDKDKEKDSVVVKTIPYTFTKENLSTIDFPIGDDGDYVPFYLVSTGLDEDNGVVFDGFNLVPQETAGAHFSPAPDYTIIPPAASEPNAVVAAIDNGYFTTTATEAETIDYSTLLPNLSVEFNAAAVQQIATTAGDSSIKLKIKDVTEFGVTDSKTIQITLVDQNDDPVYAEGTAAGTATVTVPFEVGSGKVPVVYYVNGTTKTKVDGATYNSENQTVTFTVEHFSEYEITTETPVAVASVTIGGNTQNYYDLHAALEAGKASGSVVTLLQDVNLAGVNWVPVGTSSSPFQGSFDGDGKTISHLTITGTGTYKALFGYVGGGTTEIKNVNLSYFNVSGEKRIAGLVAEVLGNARFYNCSIDANSTITGTDANIAGLIAEIQTSANSTITCEKLSNYATVSSTGSAGGTRRVAGICCQTTNGGSIANDITFKDCHNYGAVSSADYAGGIMCAAQGANSTETFDNCSNSGTLTGTYTGVLNAYLTGNKHGIVITNYSGNVSSALGALMHGAQENVYYVTIEGTLYAYKCVRNASTVTFGSLYDGATVIDKRLLDNFRSFADYLIAEEPMHRKDNVKGLSGASTDKEIFYNAMTQIVQGNLVAEGEQTSDYRNPAWVLVNYNTANGTSFDISYFKPGWTSDTLYKVDVVPTYVAQIVSDNGATTNKYETLQAAIAAASDGDTVELLADIELDKDVHVTTSGENIYSVLVDGVYKYQVAAPKLNSLTIDGAGHTISMGANPTFGRKYGLSGGSAFFFGKYGDSGEVEGTYTLKNITFENFDREIIRVGFASLNIDNCTFDGNHITETVSYCTTMIYAYQGALNVSGSTFTDNTVSGTYALIFSNNGKAAATVTIHNNLFKNNGTSAQPSGGNGLIYLSNAASVTDAITSNTFEANYVQNASGNAAVVYLSKPVETFSGNLFKDNHINVPASGKKEGVVVLGSGAAGTPVTGNAFVGNVLDSELPTKRGTIVVGGNTDLSGNYWGDGEMAEDGTGNDIYKDGDITITATTYATAYTPNASGNGTAVATLPVPVYVARIGTTKYESLAEAVAAVKAAASSERTTVTLLTNTTEVITIDFTYPILIDGQGFGISQSTTADTHTGIKITAPHADVIIQDAIVGNANVGRAVNILGAEGVTLLIKDSALYGNRYPLNVYPNGAAGVDNENITVTNSVISGPCALNLWGTNGVVKVVDSTLSATNTWAHSSGADGNDFGVIVLEGLTGTPGANGYNIEIKGSTIEAAQTTGNMEHIVLFNPNSQGNTVKLDGCVISRNGDTTHHPVIDEEANTSGNSLYVRNTTDAATSAIPVLPDGYAYTNADAEGWQLAIKPVVAVIAADGVTTNGVYGTLEAAYDAASAGETITLLADITYGADRSVPVWTKPVNIDLGGHTLTTNSEVGKNLGNGGYTAAAICFSIPAASASSIMIYNGTIVTAYGAGVYADDPGLTLTLSNLTINAATAGTQSTTEYSAAVRVTYGSKVIIESGSYSGAYAIAASNSGADFEINGGTFTGDIFFSGNTDSGKTKSVTITDGTFNGGFVNGDKGTLAISGGVFPNPVPEEYCATGYIPTAQDPVTGLYTVKEGYYVAQIVSGATTNKYEALQAALDAVPDGGTVQLLTNITLTAGVEVVKAQGGTFVLDGAGYTITAASPLSNSKIIAVYIEGKASDASAMQFDVKNLTIESDGLKYGFVLDSMQVAMSNVVVRANGGTAFCANTHASVTIDDCTIANTGSHTESWRDTALAVSYMADVTVNSGTFTSENGWAAYIFTSGGTIDVKGGTFSGKVRSSADTVGENRGDATITISGGEFSNVELTTVHDSNLNATIAVSGGWFSAQVPAMACAEGFEPTGALADAPNAAVPYTVGYAADIIYPIEGTAGVRIALAWATNNTSVVSEGAPVTAADVPNIITALGENGANNMPKWESYVLGLNPADATAVLRLAATAKNATTVTITGAIDTTKFPSISNVTVTFRLAARNDDGTWTDVEGCTGAETPSFDVALDDVAGKVLAIFADIVTE